MGYRLLAAEVLNSNRNKRAARNPQLEAFPYIYTRIIN